MAILFDYELDRLTADLGNGGFGVLRVYRFPKVPARCVQVFLDNGVFVNWDRQIGRLYIDGPAAQRSIVEEFLYLTYQASWIARSWAFHRRAVSLAAVAAILLVGGIVLRTSLHAKQHAVAARGSLTLAE